MSLDVRGISYATEGAPAEVVHRDLRTIREDQRHHGVGGVPGHLNQPERQAQQQYRRPAAPGPPGA